MGQDEMIVIIDYGMGNVRSVAKAFELIDDDVIVSNKKEDLIAAERIILPGVGAFGEGMKHLSELNLIKTLNDEVLKKKKPFLGICLGMQLLSKTSQEYGSYEGLGWIDSDVIGFDFLDTKEFKVPHVGWNNIAMDRKCILFDGINDKAEFYFVHSLYMVNNDKHDVVATCDYGVTFTAALQKNNIFATQFHPEKSQGVGLKMLENFMRYKKDDEEMKK